MTTDCGTKLCKICGLPKLLKCFHKHMHICISCNTSEAKEKRNKRPDLSVLLRGWRKPE